MLKIVLSSGAVVDLILFSFVINGLLLWKDKDVVALFVFVVDLSFELCIYWHTMIF